MALLGKLKGRRRFFFDAEKILCFCLEDHPRTCKWLITMVIVTPLRIGLFPFQMAFSWLINGGDPNYLLIGMILQVGELV